MNILHLSDTHNLHRQLSNMPAADIIVHSGDISFAGTGEEVLDFIEWFGNLDYKYKIFIAGNHDLALERKAPERIQRFLPQNCYYLCNSGVTINGINFWGVPFFFSEELEENYRQELNLIPDNTDILITHRPPHGLLDNSSNFSYGCPHLLQKVAEIRPQYHLFGHIHDAYGIVKQVPTTFANAAVVDTQYRLLNKPFVLKVCCASH
ncbi:MAG: metallophosphatase domain-containing protein [Fermentimonas sp.]|nr:metallophosphatase domain-containing protein [Fermentimonas sp.]